MKKILLGFGLLAMASCTNAASPDSGKDDFCKSVMEAAEVTMRGRLTGVSAIDAIELANKATGDINDMLRGMIIDAYSSYNYSTDEYKSSAINEFATKYYIDCIRQIT